MVSRWVRPTNIHACFSVDSAQLRLSAATQDTTTGPTDALCWSIHGPAQKRPPAANPQYHTLREGEGDNPHERKDVVNPHERREVGNFAYWYYEKRLYLSVPESARHGGSGTVALLR